MKTIASLEVDVAMELAARLKKEAIPFQIQTVTQESGLDFSDITVEDNDYDRACEVAEAWEADRLAASERRYNRHCPTCGSMHLEYVGPASLGGNILKCKDCGNGFTG